MRRDVPVLQAGRVREIWAAHGLMSHTW